MSLKDYEHWNEDAYYMWYHEEGKHQDEPDIDCDFEENYWPEDDD